MFARSAILALPRVASRSTAQPLARRWASTHSQSAGSDMPWIAGSTIIFGGAAAFLFMGGDAHAQHAVSHGTTHAKEEHEAAEEAASPTPKEPETEASPELKSIQRGLKTDSPAHAQQAETDGEDQATEPVTPQTKEGAKASPAGAETEGAPKEEAKVDEAPVEEKKEAPVEKKEEATSAEEIPEAEIQASIKQAEEFAVPKVAMEKDNES